MSKLPTICGSGGKVRPNGRMARPFADKGEWLGLGLAISSFSSFQRFPSALTRLPSHAVSNKQTYKFYFHLNHALSGHSVDAFSPSCPNPLGLEIGTGRDGRGRGGGCWRGSGEGEEGVRAAAAVGAPVRTRALRLLLRLPLQGIHRRLRRRPLVHTRPPHAIHTHRRKYPHTHPLLPTSSQHPLPGLEVAKSELYISTTVVLLAESTKWIITLAFIARSHNFAPSPLLDDLR